jgi:hypothetical protein
VDLSQEYLIETLFAYCKRPVHKKYQNIFNAECPVCKEGRSAGRTRRLFFFPAKNYFYCHNCVKSWRPLEWVREVTGLTISEIIKKNKTQSNSLQISLPKTKAPEIASDSNEQDPLPLNSIDLTDPKQLLFYEKNKFVRLAVEYCHSRRLFTAVNTCKKFFVSIEDRIHKNRLVVPFYDEQNDVVCYQTRSLTQNQFPKYLTKFGEKELFGKNNLVEEIPYVFVFEGPIDSMFVKNGVALASLSPTGKQLQDLKNLIGYEQIFVFDNDKNNKQTQKKIEKFIKEGKTVFIWPAEFVKFKDFNEICCSLELDEIPWKFVVKHSTKGPEALIKFKLLSK